MDEFSQPDGIPSGTEALKILNCPISLFQTCNCVLMGSPNCIIKPLQKTVNFAARLVVLAIRHTAAHTSDTRMLRIQQYQH